MPRSSRTGKHKRKTGPSGKRIRKPSRAGDSRPPLKERDRLGSDALARENAQDVGKALASFLMENKLGEKKLSSRQRATLEQLITESVAENMLALTRLHAPAQILADSLGQMYSMVQISRAGDVFKHFRKAEMKELARDFSEKFLSEFMKKAYEIATTFSIDVPDSGRAEEKTGGDRSACEQKMCASKFAMEKFQPTLKFKDVGGNPEAKKELSRFVAFFKAPSQFKAIGAKLPKGILLKGPQGAGKPSLAIAMAGEAGVPLVKIDSTDLVGMYAELGSEGTVRALSALKKDSFLMILIDEIPGPLPAGTDLVTIALRALFDGFARTEGILIIGATSHPEAPDVSLLRHERFGRSIPVDKPDFKARLEILRIYTTTSRKLVTQNPRKKLVDRRLDLVKWARYTAGFTPEKIENLLNDAAMLAVSENRKAAIGEEEMQSALDRIVEGAGSTHTLGEKEKEIVAVHELGHALVSQYLPNASPVAKISVVGKGEQLGYTRPYQREGRYLMSRDMLLDGVATLMGGRLAEELMYPENDRTDGASSDLQVLTDILEFAVTELGFGNGYVLPDKEHDRARLRAQVDLMVKEAETRALRVLTSHHYELFLLKDILVRKESLTGKEFLAHLRSIEKRRKKLSPKQLEKEVRRLENAHAKKLSRGVNKAAFLPSQEGFSEFSRR